MSRTPLHPADTDTDIDADIDASTDARAHARLRERFDLIVNGPALFHALATGIELGVFRTLAEGPASIEDLRASTGLATHQTDVLMQALCSTELVHKRDGRYANSSVATELLLDRGDGDWWAILRGWREIYYPAFALTTPALRAGTNTALAAIPGRAPTLYQRLSEDPAKEAVLHASMSAFTQRSMHGLLDNLGLRPGEHVLDIGGGDGTTARTLVETFPEVTVTVFDLPSVVALADQGTSDELGKRVSFVGGDLFDDPFPEQADVVLFSHCLEVLSPERIQQLMAKAHAALRPGGRLHVYGYTPTAEEHGVYSARLSLYLTVLATGQGRAYPAHVYEQLLLDAGFATVATTGDLPYEHSLITGTRAAQ